MNRFLGFVVILAASQVTFAHHGGAEYDLGKTVEFKAKLTRVDLINPHSWLYFDVTDKDGKISHHRCEMRSVHVLRRSGWTKDLFPVGQQITIEASPNKTDPASCYLQTILTADGTRRGGPAGPRLYGGSELTEAGEKAAAEFKREDNPRFRCETTSIIFDWTFDGPVNRITQSKDTIVMEYGQFGLKRTIYMNQEEHPQNIKPSRAGNSIGHWDGDTLIVDTVGFLPGFLNTPV